MSGQHEALDAFCQAVNVVKKTALTVEGIGPNQYLGGDLGIDSIEMLEIWFRIEKTLGIRIQDDEKRDIYTVEEVINVVQRNRIAVSA